MVSCDLWDKGDLEDRVAQRFDMGGNGLALDSPSQHRFHKDLEASLACSTSFNFRWEEDLDSKVDYHAREYMKKFKLSADHIFSQHNI